MLVREDRFIIAQKELININSDLLFNKGNLDVIMWIFFR